MFSSPNAPAWVQAIGSVVAIFSAIIIFQLDRYLDERAEKKRRTRLADLVYRQLTASLRELDRAIQFTSHRAENLEDEGLEYNPRAFLEMSARIIKNDLLTPLERIMTISPENWPDFELYIIFRHQYEILRGRADELSSDVLARVETEEPAWHIMSSTNTRLRSFGENFRYLRTHLEVELGVAKKLRFAVRYPNRTKADNIVATYVSPMELLIQDQARKMDADPSIRVRMEEELNELNAAEEAERQARIKRGRDFDGMLPPTD